MAPKIFRNLNRKASPPVPGVLAALVSPLLLQGYWAGVFVLSKPFFIIYNGDLFASHGIGGAVDATLHGFPLDWSVAGYMAAPSVLLCLFSLWGCGRAAWAAYRWVMVAAALAAAAALVANAALYPHWGFPLDSTPLFYFGSSPADALASIPAWQSALFAAAAMALAFLSWKGAVALQSMWLRPALCKGVRHKAAATVAAMLSAAMLFYGIRGGTGVSSMNTGRAYFSQDQRLNHAAVNPVLSLVESLSHESDFSSQYRFFKGGAAKSLAAQLAPTGSAPSVRLLKPGETKPDVYIVILESFSAHLMSSLGGNGVAEELDRAAEQGVLFSNFYANSFRTDRGLVSIMSGYPAQPTTSIMKYPRKSATLPSIAKSLAKAGYSADYYYGGDADFTNMRSYLKSQGFSTVVSEDDFPGGMRAGKWGVPDGPVFDRLAADVGKAGGKGGPHLRVLQTSSSHEPFDVPFSKLADKPLNAFAYADSCLGAFLGKLKAAGAWENSLVVLVADHQGSYPNYKDNHSLQRFHIPLVFTGGAVAGPARVAAYGSQQDIAATLLGQLGLPHSEFTFSKDMLCGGDPHFAFFTFPDAFGIAFENGHAIYGNKDGRMVEAGGEDPVGKAEIGKAYLQRLYDDLAAR